MIWTPRWRRCALSSSARRVLRELGLATIRHWAGRCSTAKSFCLLKSRRSSLQLQVLPLQKIPSKSLRKIHPKASPPCRELSLAASRGLIGSSVLATNRYTRFDCCSRLSSIEWNPVTEVYNALAPDSLHSRPLFDF